jgi:ribosomal protein L28
MQCSHLKVNRRFGIYSHPAGLRISQEKKKSSVKLTAKTFRQLTSTGLQGLVKKLLGL